MKRPAWHFKLGRRGIAAVEFAIFVPMLLILLIGTTELLTLYRTAAKLNAAAGNVAEMVSLQPTITPTAPTQGVPVTLYTVSNTALTDICNGAKSGLAPFGSASLKIAISSITLTSAAGASPATYDTWEVDNACGTNATAISAATAQSLATAGSGGSMLLFKGDNVIVVKASLNYPGLTGIFLTSAQTLTQTAFARWRLASSTTEQKCCAT
jgi:Flp pilus assembly protein TadG